MALAHALMTLLVDCPQSGYDLMKKFEGTVGYFWKATHQQIYKELAKLEKDGWLSSEVIPQEGRPDKRMYQVTAIGKQKLIDWVLQPTDPMPIREELLVKTSVSYLVPPAAMIEELQRHREMHLARLAIYRSLDQEIREQVNGAMSAEWQCRYLALRRGIRYEKEYVDWCNESITVLQAMESGHFPTLEPL